MDRNTPTIEHLRCRLPRRGAVLAGLSVLALVFLSYIAGGAVLFFNFPTAESMRKAFTAAEALNEREFHTADVGSSQDALNHITVTIDEPTRTQNGFTLVTTTEASRATLLDMRGNIVHRWELPFSRAWPNAPHVRRPIADAQIHWFRCYLYPDGDLLAVYHANGDTPYGYGLARLDRESKLRWTFSENVHHDVEVDEDGTIYTLTQRYEDADPSAPNTILNRRLADYLVVLAADGTKKKEISILDAFRTSPFAALLNLLDPPVPEGIPASSPDLVGFAASDAQRPAVPSHDPTHGDYLHANSVRVLRRSQAAHFPLFKAGDVLISVRNIDTIAVLNIETGRVVWAVRGPWRHQHDVDFLSNGSILLYDNLGSLAHARVLEYDPHTQAINWSYAGEDTAPFQAFARGSCQRLDNGNTLVVDPNHQRVFEVTPDKKRVWECACPARPLAGVGPVVPFQCAITSARRYPPELPFLKGETHARP